MPLRKAAACDITEADIACVLILKKALSRLLEAQGAPGAAEVYRPRIRTPAHSASTDVTSAVGTVQSPSRVYSPMLAEIS